MASVTTVQGTGGGSAMDELWVGAKDPKLQTLTKVCVKSLQCFREENPASLSRRAKMELLNCDLILESLLASGKISWTGHPKEGHRVLADILKSLRKVPVCGGELPSCAEEAARLKLRLEALSSLGVSERNEAMDQLVADFERRLEHPGPGQTLVRVGAGMFIPVGVKTLLGFLLPPLWASAAMSAGVASAVIGSGLACKFVNGKKVQSTEAKLMVLFQQVMREQRKPGTYSLEGHSVELDYETRLDLVYRWSKGIRPLIGPPLQVWMAQRDNFGRFLDLQGRVDSFSQAWKSLILLEARNLCWGNEQDLPVIEELPDSFFQGLESATPL